VSTRSSFTARVDQSNGGLELTLSAAALGLAGWWLDRRLGTSPILLLTCGFLGFIGSALSLYYRYVAQIARLRAEAEAMRAEATIRATAATAPTGELVEDGPAGASP
jgi:hypothetical protein